MNARQSSVLLILALGLTFVHADAPCLSKRSFLTSLNDHLSSVKTTTCADSGREASWSEYCTSEAVRPCPALNKEPHPDFYLVHCILYYVYLKVNEWPNATFSSTATMRTALTELYSNLPREKCGYRPADNCKRDESVCYRKINPDGVCIPLDRVCVKFQYPDLCQTAGQVYKLKQALLLLLDSGDCDWIETTTKQGSTTIAPMLSTEQRFWIGAGCVAALVVVVIVIIVIVFFVHRRLRRKSNPNQPGSPGSLELDPTQDPASPLLAPTAAAPPPPTTPTTAQQNPVDRVDPSALQESKPVTSLPTSEQCTDNYNGSARIDLTIRTGPVSNSH